MKSGYGVFIEYQDRSIRAVAVTELHTKAQAILYRLQQYLAAKERFGVAPAQARDPEDQKLFAFFEKLDKGKRLSPIVRTGVGEVLLFIDCLEAENESH